jgi:DNA polymerase elongation subunit (family B)
MPQFGVNVLSASIVGMHQIIREAHKMGIRILYTNTDCLLFEVDQDEKMGKYIGPGLGQFDYEFREYSRKFVCLSKKKYLHCFENGTFRVRFPPKGVEEKDWEAWFDRKYFEKISKA